MPEFVEIAWFARFLTHASLYVGPISAFEQRLHAITHQPANKKAGPDQSSAFAALSSFFFGHSVYASWFPRGKYLCANLRTTPAEGVVHYGLLRISLGQFGYPQLMVCLCVLPTL